MKNNWMSMVIFSNLRMNKMANAINIFSLSLGIIVFSLFGGFYLTQSQIISEQEKNFPEYLSAKLEKSEIISSQSDFLKLKQVTRPSQSELNSFLAQKLSATHHLNYENIFTSLDFSLFGGKLPPFTTVFLKSFNLSQLQMDLLVEHNQVSENSNFIFVNMAMLKVIKNSYQIPNTLDLVFNYQKQLEVDNIKISLHKNFIVQGVFSELEYMSNPKVYFSQQALDSYFQNFVVDQTTLYDLIANLAPDHYLGAYSYRLFFASISDLKRAQYISNSLMDASSSLVVTGEHLTRIDSLKEIFTFMNIVMTISVFLLVISFLFINITITHLELKKNNAKMALLYYFGAKTVDIISIYLKQNFLIVTLAMGGLLFVPKLEVLINTFIYNTLVIKQLINTPLLVYQGFPLLIPLVIFLLMLVSASVIVVINIILKNQKALVKRLAHND